MKDFRSTEGTVNSGVSGEAAPLQGPAQTMSCCTDNSPSGELAPKGPGTGISANSARIR